MASGKVFRTTEGTVATITINRPAKLNALDPEMMAMLEHEVDQIDRDSSVHAVLLRAEGDRAFCVGADINAWAALESIDMWRRWIRDGHRVIDRIANVRQPVVVAINGLALGGGLELALAGDLRVASENAEFGMPEVKIGTLPGWGGTSRLNALVGPARAKHLIFTGKRINAETARNWGLVNESVPSEILLSSARALLDEICSNAPISVQLAKELVNADTGTGATRAMEGTAAGLAAHTDDGQEGVAAFRERREARFEGR